MSETVQIPKGWQQVYTLDVVEDPKTSVRIGPFGSSLKKHELTDSGIRVLFIENVVNNKFEYKTGKFITPAKYKELQNFTVKPKDILVTMMGTIGRICILPEDIGTAIISSHLVKITLDQKKIIPEYFALLLQSPITFNQMKKESRGISMPGLNSKIIKNLEFLLPPISTQKKIVQKLDDILGQLQEKKKEIFSIIDQNKAKIDFFEKNWMSYLIEKEIEHHPKRKEWKLKKLGDPEISEIIMGQSPPSSTYNTEQNGMPFFQGKKDFGEKYPTAKTWCTKPNRIAKKGDILLSVRAPVGSINWAKEECCIGRGISAIRPKIEEQFIYYKLQSLSKELSHSGSGCVFNSIGKDFLYQIPIPLPPLQIQKQIVQNIKSAEQKFQSQKAQFENIKQNYENIINHINHIQSSILDTAFSGKLIN